MIDRPRDGILFMDIAAAVGVALLGVCAMVGLCVIVLSLV